MKALINNFLRSEDGAVTVDWVVLTAAIVGLGLVIGTTVGNSTADLATDIAASVSSVTPTTYGGPGAGSGGSAPPPVTP
jgi:Flp pilus assembly pilin Flp